METQEQLLRDVELFLKTHGMAESTFGKHAVSDGKFVKRLRDGANMTTRTIARVRQFMATAPSKGTEGLSAQAREHAA